MRSTGDEHGLSAFEGLVQTTARMWAAQVRREEHDLAQELRIRVWRAITSYDPSKSRLPLERYVFQAVTNKIKDFKRDAQRERDRCERYGLSFIHLEDWRSETGQLGLDGVHFIDHDEVYRAVDEGYFVLPSSVTRREAKVLVLLMMELSRPKVALRLGIGTEGVDQCIASLRVKFADWRPSSSSRRVPVDVAVAA